MAARQPSRGAMHKLRESGKLFAFCGALGAGLFMAGALFSPLQGAREWLSNPFGFSRSVTPSGPVVLLSMQKLARLETAKFNGQAIVTGENKGVLPVILAGDRLVFIGHGDVVAGIDLSKMKDGDVTINGTTARVHLPRAEVFSTRLDNKTSQVFERQTGIFSAPDRDIETQTRQSAEDRLREAALQSGILENAKNNAKETVRGQLKTFGFNGVEFVD